MRRRSGPTPSAAHASHVSGLDTERPYDGRWLPSGVSAHRIAEPTLIRDAVAQRLNTHASTAAQACPSLLACSTRASTRTSYGTVVPWHCCRPASAPRSSRSDSAASRPASRTGRSPRRCGSRRGRWSAGGASGARRAWPGWRRRDRLVGPAVGHTDSAAGAGVGARSAGAWAGRPAVDAGPGEDADRPPVPHLVHGGGYVAAAEAARLVVAAARRRAIERDDDAVELWRREVWPRVRAPRR